MHLPPTPGGDSSSIGGSTITAGSVAEAHLSTTEALARQQLMAELREASNLMAESVTPEAATFWRNHVVDLQARLRALHGEGGDDVNFAAAEANRQLLEQYNRKTEPPPKYTVEPPKFEPIYQPTFHEPSYEQQRYQPPADRTFTPVVEPPAPKRQVVSITRKSAGQAKPMVDVIAPANLPGGYHFEAEIQGRRFLATVPAGGVHKGETFSCVMRDLETVGVGTPVGRWRDRLCDCGIYGLCHALVCMTILCPLLALSQVMTRLNYDFLGRASDVKRARTAWSTMWSILIFHVMMNGLIYTAYCYKWSENIPLSSADVAAVVLLNASLVVYAIYATLSTRASLREKYMIREHRFFDLEDCCCATFCMPCTICQMARHTAHYDNVDAVCCSATGLHQKGRSAHVGPSRGAEIV
jgi:Cys-rich protein (TIGR01571 family)